MGKFLTLFGDARPIIGGRDGVVAPWTLCYKLFDVRFGVAIACTLPRLGDRPRCNCWGSNRERQGCVCRFTGILADDSGMRLTQFEIPMPVLGILITWLHSANALYSCLSVVLLKCSQQAVDRQDTFSIL